jgi:2-hydroxy-3-oxopropionate reductase
MGVDYLDAPVSGGVKGATEASLAIMVGGAESTFARAQPAFAAMGRATLVGPNGSGQLAKLANQAIVGITIEAVAEALLLAAAGGADPAKVREALMGGFADSKILSLHGQRMLDRNWLPGGAMRTHLKDMRTILAEADIAGVALPAAKLVGALFGAAVEHGFGGCDHSGLLLELERANPGKRVGEAPDQRPTE